MRTKGNYYCNISTFICISLFLFGCSSERTPNVENFRNALNKKLHQHRHKICFSDENFHFPIVVSKKEKSGPAIIAKLDAMSAAGLLHRKKTVKQLKNRKRRGIKMEIAFEYRLAGSAYTASKRIRKNKRWIRKFCYANLHAKKIVSFSPPKKSNHKTTTQIVYTQTLTKVSKWANNEKFIHLFPQLRKNIALIKQPTKQKATLQLGKKRWVFK